MKKFKLILLIILGIIVMNSCKKKYSGCCKYTQTRVNTGQQQITDFCENDIDEGKKDQYMSNYNDLVDKQGQSIGATWEYKITGEGCNFHKGK